MPDREPAAWAGVDKNVNNDTYALADGTIIRRDNDLTKLYNRVYGKIYRVKRRGDRRVMGNLAGKAWKKYTNCVKDHFAKRLGGRRTTASPSDTRISLYTNSTPKTAKWRRSRAAD